jgi:hypothetical protein
MPSISTHIGVAFYATGDFAILPAVVLSSHMRFDNNVLFGAVAETVNGISLHWKEHDQSPVAFEPYMNLVGIFKVATVDDAPMNVYRFIRNLGWMPPNVNANSINLTGKEPLSTDYVCRVLSYLSNAGTINLPYNVRMDLDGYITQALKKLNHVQAPRLNLYPIITPVEGEEPLYGKKNF